MLDWNPALDRREKDERTRAAQALLARVPLTEATRVVALGCGPGHFTELMPNVRFELDGIECEARAPADAAPDLIDVNAALQWAPGHPSLIPRRSAVAPKAV